MDKVKLREKLTAKGLKVTPQRILVFEALLESQEHPTAEQIITLVRNENPNIAVGTIYNILDGFVHNGLLNKVKTEGEKMRYDVLMANHHHLYDLESEKISDHFDTVLSELIIEYLRKNEIPGFSIENISLQITGRHSE